MFDEKIIKYASPTISGIKTGSLFKVYPFEIGDMKKTFNFYNKIFSKYNMHLYVLYECNSYILVYLFRIDLLKKDLHNKEYIDFLIKLQYPVNSLFSILSHLKYRFKIFKKTPHEIGLFLGYPFDDVIGFIINNGKHYKLLGCWKVYGNEKKCEEIFNIYKKCKNNNIKLFNMGYNLESLIYKSN